MRERAVTAGFCLLLVGLAATSSLRFVGDGEEYLRLAERIGHFTAPGGISRHFWLYSALAAPLVRLVSALGLNPLVGFTLLNILLLTATFRVVLPRIGLSPTLLLMVGPILWWVDKAHTETLTFSFVAMGFALIRAAPWWAFVALALAGMQNLPIAVALPAAAAASLAIRSELIKDRRWWIGLSAAIAILVVTLAYNLVHHGRLTPLLDRPHLEVPSFLMFAAPLTDSNLGLLTNFVTMPLALLALSILLIVKAPRALLAPDVLAACVAFVAFLFGASQTTNFNHGGTPGMSRYAMWILPLSVALLACARESLTARARRFVLPVAVVSASWSLVAFHPGRAERTGEPTALARYLWTRHPSFENPLPEVFVERLHGIDDNWVPAATSGCEKVLLQGRGVGRGIWPVPCPPVPVPAACLEAGRLCYANKTDKDYQFVVLPLRNHEFRFRREDTWPLAAEPTAAALFSRLDWRALGPSTMVESSQAIQSTRALEGSTGAVIALRGIEPGASLTVRSKTAATGTFIRAETGEQLTTIPIQQGSSTVIIPAGEAFLILAIQF
jgi:hypothetical protein